MDRITIAKNKTEQQRNLYKPVFFRFNNPEEKARFDELLQAEDIFLYDEIVPQLQEMFKIRNPTKQLTDEEYDSLIHEHTNGDLTSYGVWVYYPWSKRIVHLLDEAEFIEVRTSRNQYKITLRERDILATKVIGVIGLSVGQSVAVTLAMERSFKEIRLADFDLLELTNLNRIRTGVQNLGLKKVISVAREIAEIDPYLKVTIFEDGLTEENMDAFYLEGGKLDALIDECDGVDMKILCRVKAKELGIPVLMEASDRCTIDVERFDLEPDRSILHGFVDHLDISKLKHLKTNEEKMPYLAPIVGLNTISARLKASGVEIGHTITTWPQLASAVALGGGAVADIWRRIALDQYHESGRYFVDMEELVGDKQRKENSDVVPNPFHPLELEKLKDVAAKVISADDKSEIALTQEQVAAIVDAAGTAPSGGNAQPWKWVYEKGVLVLFFDRYFGFSFMDYKDTASMIALGAAIENVILKSHELGFETKVKYHPEGNSDDVVASFTFFPNATSQDGIEPHTDDNLSKVIFQRHTNRRITQQVELGQEVYDQFQSCVSSIKGTKLKFFHDPAILEATGRIISETDRYRVLSPQSHYDFTYQEMRWTEAEAIERKTGMGITTLELSPAHLLGVRLIRDPKVVAILRDIDGGKVLSTASIKNMTTASAMGLLTIEGTDQQAFLDGGRASQKLWLKATELDIAFHPMNVPVAFFQRLEQNAPDMPPGITPHIKELYNEFRDMTGYKGLDGNESIIYLFRVFKAPGPQILPYRKDVKNILITA
ncbi:MAG: hypothetical protein BGO70_14630 [Bacteroidetes bacterium 43-93]|nr:Rv1355c family protein [Bacteroidota bacterium]OJW97028.1 MAG: hypothetical protein BGO70_14630 [Bacteroidetes bacterium 43-93]